MDMMEPWNGSPFFGENMSNDSNQPRWNHWSTPQTQVEFLQMSCWDPPFQNTSGQMKSSSPDFVDSRLDMGSPTSSSFFSHPQNNNLKPSYTESSHAPIFGGKMWTSTANSMVNAWEDANMSQMIPSEFVDCITYSVMQDPVITADGHSYERSAIETWLK
jgi:hypothetical protein